MAFASNKSKGGKGLVGEINVTPFVDVVLVLLVIFMITAPMLQTGIQVDLPKATLDPIPSDSKPTIVTIDRDGRIYVGKTEFLDSEIATKLVPLLQRNKGKTIYLRADEKLPYGKVTGLISVMHNHGIGKVSLVTESE